jgi:hypothetical protein
VDTIGPQNSTRKHPRKPCEGAARLFFDGTYSPAQLVDVSEGGMLVSTALVLEPQQQILAHFPVGDVYLRAKVEVVYTLPDRSAGSGFRVGMRFTSISDYGVNVIRSF